MKVLVPVTAALAALTAACAALPPPTRPADAGAPITAGIAQPRAAKPAPLQPIPDPAYALPPSGPDTLSLAVTGCFDGCPVVSVLLDPDGYWQRTAPEGNTSGKASDGLYDQLTTLFAAQGFYAFEGRLDLVKENTPLCTTHEAGGQVFFLGLARSGTSRQINYDTGCAGSSSADAAADAINALVGVAEYMDIVSGPPVTP